MYQKIPSLRWRQSAFQALPHFVAGCSPSHLLARQGSCGKGDNCHRWPGTSYTFHSWAGETGGRGQILIPQVPPGSTEHYNLCIAALSSSQFGHWLFLALKRSWRLLITLHFQNRWEQKSQKQKPLTPVPFILQAKQRDAALWKHKFHFRVLFSYRQEAFCQQETPQARQQLWIKPRGLHSPTMQPQFLTSAQ